MSDIAIQVKDLSKLYHIGARQEHHDTLRDALSGLFQRKDMQHQSETDLWALKDVSFEVKRGDVVGIVGRNGAGKSTLLKILSRITEPTNGEVRIRGRVRALLEVGTGFHPELTGRENIYLNGAILGMRRTEIDRQFDHIVAFSEIEEFLDTPVKRYSSGMYVRLAFAVAAHLEPEILLVDEVLAVGDFEFQKKCLGAIGEIAKDGRTVLFVSHNMGVINELCNRAILFASGVMTFDNTPSRVIDRYLSVANGNQSSRVWTAESAPGENLKLLRISISDIDGIPQRTFRSDSAVEIRLEYALGRALLGVRLGIRVMGSNNAILFATTDHDSHTKISERSVGMYKSVCTIPPNLLNAGRYAICVTADIPMREILLETEPLVYFDIDLVGAIGTRQADRRPGFFRPLLDWTTEKLT